MATTAKNCSSRKVLRKQMGKKEMCWNSASLLCIAWKKLGKNVQLGPEFKFNPAPQQPRGISLQARVQIVLEAFLTSWSAENGWLPTMWFSSSFLPFCRSGQGRGNISVLTELPNWAVIRYGAGRGLPPLCNSLLAAESRFSHRWVAMLGGRRSYTVLILIWDTAKFPWSPRHRGCEWSC